MKKLITAKLIIINVLLGFLTIVLGVILIIITINNGTAGEITALSTLVGMLITGFFTELKWLHKAAEIELKKDISKIKEINNGAKSITNGK